MRIQQNHERFVVMLLMTGVRQRKRYQHASFFRVTLQMFCLPFVYNIQITCFKSFIVTLRHMSKQTYDYRQQSSIKSVRAMDPCPC